MFGRNMKITKVTFSRQRPGTRLDPETGRWTGWRASINVGPFETEAAAAEFSSRTIRAAAAAREREASRRERFEADAQKVRAEQLSVQKQIAANTSRLNEVAANGGKVAIDLALKNETGNPATAKVATQDDVKDTFHFSGFGLAGGTNL